MDGAVTREMRAVPFTRVVLRITRVEGNVLRRLLSQYRTAAHDPAPGVRSIRVEFVDGWSLDCEVEEAGR